MAEEEGAASAASAPAEAENVAVCIRVRPMNERETRADDAHALSCVPKLNVISLNDPETGAPMSGKGSVFQYDEIFDASSDSRFIYERVARRIVRSTLGGINGTIFAYGQTSSGKTFTMQGDGAMPFAEPEEEEEQGAITPGVLQLAVEDIFRYIEASKDRDFLLRVSFLEIYNEVVRDLLNPSADNLKLREDPRKGVYVESKEKIITNYEDIVTLLQTGNRNRTVGHTAMNDKSSRSHSVFRIVIESKQKAVEEARRLSEEELDGAVLVASLNLVDLAGSESLRHTGAEGIRQREAGNINKSLLTLARVINSLASSGGGGQNAPFRDSKLTRLLQNSLGGNTRTLIICCVTPSDRYIEETKSTLQFAARAKDIQTTATVNEVLDDQTQLRRLKREVHELKKLVNSEALDALKAENEALISEKNHNETEMARLKGLILSSSSVTKPTVVSKRRQKGKRMRETWGPGDFPANKALGPFSSNVYPRKRQAKENVDPQTLFRVYEDVDDNAAKDAEDPALDSPMSKHNPTRTDLSAKDSSKKILDLFSAVFRSYSDENCEDPIAALETTANKRCESLGNIERAHAFDVLADIRNLMVANVQSRAVLDEKLLLEQEVKDLRSRLNESNINENCESWECSGNVSTAAIEEIAAELASTQEALAMEKERYQSLETEKTNSQLMAAEELDTLRSQLEVLKLESNESQHRFASEKRELEAALEKLQSRLPESSGEEKLCLHSRKDELESLVEEMKASQTVLQLAVAKRDEEITSLKTELETRIQCLEEEKTQLQQKVNLLEGEQLANEVPPSGNDNVQQSASITDQNESAVVEKLAGELQDIMQELAQMQSDNERTAQEKEELQEEIDKLSEELEVAQRQGYEMSEALMEKEHIAKVLQAQLDAKLMTISQLQTKHSAEIETLQQRNQDLTAEKEQQALDTSDNTADGESGGLSSTGCITANDSVQEDPNGKQDVGMETQKLHSEVEQLTEKLCAVESELVETKARLQAAVYSPEEPPAPSKLQATFDEQNADSDNLQQESKPTSDASLEIQDEHAEVPSSGDQNIDPPERKLSLQHFDMLNDDYKRITIELENASRERNDCMEELRALEFQLMEVSEEKMKLVVAADEQELKLREVQWIASSSSETIALLQVQLEEAQSAKATLEASKAELEQSAAVVQTTLTALKADHVAIVEQMSHRDTTLKPDDGDTIAAEVEQLQQRLEIESKQRDKLQLDVQSYEETLSVLRSEAKQSSDTIADLLEKMKMLETDLSSASHSQEQKDKELTKLTDALARSEEEQQEMRLQSKQRLVAAERKEMMLEEKIDALEQQLNVSSTAVSMVNMSMQNGTPTEFTESLEKTPELQARVTTLENQLADAREELHNQDEAWNKKEAMAKREFARLMTEQQQLREQVSALRNGFGASQNEMEAQAGELLKATQSCTELLEQKEAVHRELEAAKVAWGEKQLDLMHQLDSVREQFQEAEVDLDECKKNADAEILRLRSVIEQTDAEIEELKHSLQASEKALECRIGEQEDWQNQVKNQQEALQSKCDELDDGRRILKEKYAALEAERGDVEEQLQTQIQELSQKYAASQAQQANYQTKLKEMEAQLEMTENEVTQNRNELARLTESMKSAQKEAVEYHDKLVEAQLAQESMEKLIETQKARIHKLDKVKMTTDILDLFRNLKKTRHDLQAKVQELQKDLAQAKQTLAQSNQDHQEQEQRLVEHKDEELTLVKEQVEELHEALRAEQQQAANLKAEMRAAMNDEREKAEHEIEEMQVLVKEKMELVEKLESQVASVKDAMVKLRDQKSENVSYLEKENLELHVENRELKKRLETAALLPEKDELMGDTGTYDASAAAAVKVLGEDIGGAANESEVNVVADDSDVATKPPSQQQEASANKVNGFLLSTAELDAIAADSQEEPKEDERPECTQQ